MLDGTKITEVTMEHRTQEIKGALWWLERRAKGFARWIEHSGELKERFEIAIVDPVDSAEGGATDSPRPGPSDEPKVG